MIRSVFGRAVCSRRRRQTRIVELSGIVSMRRFESCRTRAPFWCAILASWQLVSRRGHTTGAERKVFSIPGRPDLLICHSPGTISFFAHRCHRVGTRAHAASRPRCLVLLSSPTVSTASSHCWRPSVVALTTKQVNRIAHRLHLFFWPCLRAAWHHGVPRAEDYATANCTFDYAVLLDILTFSLFFPLFLVLCW